MLLISSAIITDPFLSSSFTSSNNLLAKEAINPPMNIAPLLSNPFSSSGTPLLTTLFSTDENNFTS